MHYFDTVSFEPPNEYNNILLCMNNAIITIPDDDCEIVPNPFPSNNNNTIDTTHDGECVIVPSPTGNITTSKHTSKHIKVTGNKPNYDAPRPLFVWLPIDTIKKTFQLTTQYARISMSAIIKNHYKSLFPAMNVTRRDEPVATDNIYSDTLAIDDGCKQAHIFVGTKIIFTYIRHEN